MNRIKIVILLLAAALVYGGFIWAHGRFDRVRTPMAVGDRPADATPAFDLLLRDGLAALDGARERLEALGGPDAAALVALLPQRSEPWVEVVERLYADPPRPPFTPSSFEVVEPRGRVMPGRPAVFIRTAMPGYVDLAISGDFGAGEVTVRAKMPCNRRDPFPEDAALQPGRRYRLVACAPETDDVLADWEVTAVDEAEVERVREQMSLLRRSVQDPRVRTYAQGVIAMSQGLWGEAWDILARRLPPPSEPRAEAGLSARLVFLYDWRSSPGLRTEALRQLQRARS